MVLHVVLYPEFNTVFGACLNSPESLGIQTTRDVDAVAADDLKRSRLIYGANSWNRCVDWIKLKNRKIMYLCTLPLIEDGNMINGRVLLNSRDGE